MNRHGRVGSIQRPPLLHYHGGLKEGTHVYLQAQPDRHSLFTNQDVLAEMGNAPYIKSRLFFVAALALPAFLFINGCKSAATQAVTAPEEMVTNDAALAARVKQALVSDSELRSLPMSVATYRGVVQLSGYLDSEAQIQKALAVTHGVPGVKSVSNDLHLRSQ
jgi:hyperosmotically inducible periplasmic protein